MTERLWLRMELFEHFALQLQSRCVAKLTPQLISNAVASLVELTTAHATVGSQPLPSAPLTHAISYAMWKRVAESTFQWKENECRSFWLVLVFLHHQIVVPSVDDAMDRRDPSFLADEDYYLQEHVPLFKLAIFVLLHTDKKTSLSKHRAKPFFDAVWRKDDHPMSSPLSSGSTSPVHLAAPSSPSSPHSVGLRDRLESETHALNFVKANLTFLFSLLFNIDPTDEAQSHAITASQLDMLGFLFNGGTTHLLQYPSLSAAYPKWQDSQPPHQAASKVCNWLRKRAALNDTLYPPVGSFALSNNPIASMHMNVPVLQEMEVDEGPLDGHTQAPLVELPRPIVISSVSKATVIKRAEEFAANCDVTIHGCHDTYIYVLGPLRHVSVVASSNCKIVLGPASGICTVDRCDSTKVSAVCALLRVNNCLDSTFNIFTPRRSIFTGDNRGLHVGPFNALYAHLPVHLGQSGLAYVRHSTGQWNKFINLDTEEREGTVHADDVVLQSPLHFTEVCVPVKMDPVPPHDPPFALPPDFALAVRKMQDNVDGLRRLIASDEFDAPTKKLLEQAIQVKFKEWLATSGNTRQVLDLVQLEKARHLG
ncbi:hypothetical protein H310_01383 [Aphanomyces invadans]|uniref:C-CAP/cofactor C-like domain-containing protein n=1 Tax=Aphanomyces invadans TaxID=157072 RepID=A0A024URI0_9STRA|nr:hypothetical protein H310_01383 [Aphanomyces invadans]ETW08889.1 hypothetical protein H310_01383 [Aphanomyces invadans]|eukprot:XP_008862694.1 hypothetical protein H310_01383 [Aphanomyces invadans]